MNGIDAVAVAVGQDWRAIEVWRRMWTTPVADAAG